MQGLIRQDQTRALFVGEFGGYAVVETDSPDELQYLCTVFAALSAQDTRCGFPT